MNSTAPAPSIDDTYWNFTVAGLVFLVCMEAGYFWLAGVPSFYVPSIDGFGPAGQAAIGRDFLNVWMGGVSALAGGPVAWFDIEVYNHFLQKMLGSEELHSHNWGYPPHILLLIWPFGFMPYFAAFVVWSAFGLATFLLAASAGGVERKHLLFVAFAPAVALNLFFGQNGCLTAALLIGGLINLDRRPILAGVLFGILTVKPQLGTLLPVMLVLTGRWRVIAAAMVTTAGMVTVTSWLYGVDIWWEYLDKAVPVQRYVHENNGGLTLLQVPSAFMAGRLIGLPIRIDWAIQTVISILTLAAVVWTFWRPRDQILSATFLLTAIFLFSPYSLNYDFVVLAWVAALVRQRPDNNRFDHALILALWTLPVTMMIVGLAKIPLGFLVLAGFAARILQRLAQSEASGAPACTARGLSSIRST